MSEPLVEARDAQPGSDDLPLDLHIGSGLTVLLGDDEERLIRYLRMLAGVMPPVHGAVTLLGAPPACAEYGGRELRRRVGYVTPHAPLLSVLDGVRNVALPALYHQLADEEELMPKVEALLAEMGGDYDHRLLPAYMPALQRRMLLLARALILAPELLFIERPLLGLDNRSRDHLRSYLFSAVLPRVRALVLASNDPEVARGAQQVVFIGAGRHWIFEGWTALLANADTEVQEFIEREQQRCAVLQG